MERAMEGVVDVIAREDWIWWNESGEKQVVFNQGEPFPNYLCDVYNKHVHDIHWREWYDYPFEDWIRDRAAELLTFREWIAGLIPLSAGWIPLSVGYDFYLRTHAPPTIDADTRPRARPPIVADSLREIRQLEWWRGSLQRLMLEDSGETFPDWPYAAYREHVDRFTPPGNQEAFGAFGRHQNLKEWIEEFDFTRLGHEFFLHLEGHRPVFVETNDPFNLGNPYPAQDPLSLRRMPTINPHRNYLREEAQMARYGRFPLRGP